MCPWHLHCQTIDTLLDFLTTVKPHLVATSLIRLPHYSGQVWKVQMCFPYNLTDLIFDKVAKASSYYLQDQTNVKSSQESGHPMIE